MNLYNLLRYLIKSGAQTGGLSKEQTYDALNLIDELEKVSGFGAVVTRTYGKHDFKPPAGVNWSICGTCGKGYNQCQA